MNNNLTLFGSYWKDLLVNLLPGYIAFFILAHFFQLNAPISLAFFYLAALVHSVDCGHAFTSTWRSYLREDYSVDKMLFFVSPFVITGILFVAFHWFPRYCHWLIITYSVIHGYKQLCGVLRWYQLKQNHYETHSMKAMKIAMWSFLAVGLFDPYMQGFPDYRPPSSAIIHYIGVFTMVGAIVWAVYKEFSQDKSVINHPKILYLATTPIMFMLCMKFASHYMHFELALLFAHSIQYYGVVYLVQKKRVKASFSKFLAISAFLSLIGFIFFMAIPKQFDFYDLVFQFKFFTWQNMGENWKLALANAVANLPIFLHFWLDGFIWNYKRDPKLLEIFQPDGKIDEAFTNKPEAYEASPSLGGESESQPIADVALTTDP